MTVFGAPELTLHQSVKYVAAAYIVFLALVLIYVAIMARRARRTERELMELRRSVAATVAGETESARAAERERQAVHQP